jgi:hypothetical protein
MNKKIIPLFIMLSLFSLLSSYSDCVVDNSFFEKQDVYFCSSICQYKNPSNQTEIFDCDSNISCSFSANYPNGQSMIAGKEMNLISENNKTFFVLNVSSYINDSITRGIYPLRISCNYQNGTINYPTINSFFSVSKIPTISYAGEKKVNLTDEQKEELSEEIYEQTKDKFFKDYIAYIIGFFLFVFLIFLMVKNKVPIRHREFNKER